MHQSTMLFKIFASSVEVDSGFCASFKFLMVLSNNDLSKFKFETSFSFFWDSDEIVAVYWDFKLVSATILSNCCWVILCRSWFTLPSGMASSVLNLDPACGPDSFTFMALLSSFIQPVIGSELNCSQTLHDMISCICKCWLGSWKTASPSSSSGKALSML